MTLSEQLKAQRKKQANGSNVQQSQPSLSEQLKASRLPTQMSATTPTFKTVDEALEYAKNNNINLLNSNVENARMAENANKLKNEIPEENIIEMKRKSVGDVIGDAAENLWVNTLGGTANTINALNSVNEKLTGRDTTSIDAKNLLDYNNQNQKWYDSVIDVYRSVGNFVNPITKSITSATSFGQTPNSAYSRLEQIYKTNPNNLKLKKLYDEITNKTYTGTVEELQQELNDIQISLYNDFVDKYTRDEAEAVAKRQQRNVDEYGAFGEMAMNAFGQVGNMVPSMITSVIAPTVGMTTLGLNAGGNAMGQAINEGAGYNQAMAYGTLSGVAEAGIETLSGGLSNKLMNVKGVFNPSNLTAKIGNRFLRGAANTVLDVTGEGIEEVAAAALDPVLQKLTYNPNAQMVTGEELWLSFRDSILPTLLMQGGGVALNKVNEYHAKQVEKIKNSNLPQDKKTELINETTLEKDKIVNEIQNTQQPVQNIAPQSPNGQIQQQTNEVIPQQTENQQNENIVQNNAQIAQNAPNNVQISQNNIQNAQDLQKTGQNDTKAEIVYNKDGSFNKVKIKENIFENKGNKSIIQTIKQYLTKHIGEYADIIESGQRVYLGKDLPGEYTYSKSAQSLNKTQQLAKGRAASGLKEIINNATNRQYEPNKKDKHAIDGKYGFYKYDTTFAFEHNGKEQNYTGTILIRNDADGKKYLYDILNIKKIGSNLPPATSNSQKSSVVNGGSNQIPTNNGSLTTNVHPGLQLSNVTDSSASINSILPQKQNYVNNQENIMPSVEQLQARDLKQGEEISNTLNMKKPKLEESENSMTLKTRKFTESARNVPGVPSEYKKAIKNNPDSLYQPISNQETISKAKQIIKNNKNIESEFLENDLIFAEDTAVGELLIKNALEKNDIKRANELTASLAEKLTRAGQVVQAASLIKRMTPEGMLLYGQKQLKNAVDTIRKDNPNYYEKLKQEGIINENGKIELSEEEASQIIDNIDKAQGMKDGREKDVLIGKTMSIIANKIPSTALEKVASLRRSGLLLNLKTLSRNVGSNLTMGALETFKDIPATAIDSLLSLVTGQRTTKLPSLKVYGKGAYKGLKNAVEDVYLGIDTSSNKNGKYSISKKGKAFKRKNTYKQIMLMYKQGQTKQAVKATFNRLLSDYEDTATFIVDGTDKPFWQGRFETELKRQMELNNLVYGEDIPTTEMLEIATEQADYATFKNKTKISQAFGGLKNVFNAGKPIGMADALGLTFTNVPGNVASKVIDYTIGNPKETIKQIYNLASKNGKFNQRKFVDGLARSMTGTGAITLGAWLISKGILRGSNDDDEDIANMEKAMGLQENSINLSALKRLIKGEDTTLQEGDKFYTFDWNQPFSATWIMGADMYKAWQNDENIVWAGVKSAVNQIADMSSISTVSKLLRGYSGEDVAQNVMNVILEFPASFIPTIFNNIGQFTDEYYRQTKDATSNVKTSINKLLNKIPGVRKTLEKRVDTFGNDVVQYKDGNDFWSTFVDPGYKSTYNPTATQQELLKVYKETGDKSIFPIQVDNSIKYQEETKKLTAKEINTYQRATGKYANETFDALINAPYYDTLKPEERAELFKKVVEDSNFIGKASVGIQTKDYLQYEEKIEDLKQSGISLIDYYNAWIAQKDEEGEKNILTGKTKTGTKKQARIKAIDEAVGDNLNTWQINKLYDILN